MSIKIFPVTPDFVAEVGDVDLSVFGLSGSVIGLSGSVVGLSGSGALRAAELAEIKQAFWKYAVLIFPGQQLNQEQQLAFARHFGPLETGTGLSRGEKPLRLRRELADVSNVDHEGRLLESGGKLGHYQLGNRLWHTDASFRHVPALCSLLYATEIPPIGGCTEFADQRAAFDALPEETKKEIEGKVAEHSIFTSRAKVGMTEFDEEERKAFPTVHQVLARTIPESGRRSLYVAAHAGRVLGVPEKEGRALIERLIEHTTQRQFVYIHRWRVNDLVMWDNRCTLHRGTDFDETRWKRVMQRATVSDIANSCEQEGVSVSV